MTFLSTKREGLTATAERPREIDFSGHPGTVALNRICTELMILIGPMLWAALIVLFLWAEFLAQ